jgi:hypothetical protein
MTRVKVARPSTAVEGQPARRKVRTTRCARLEVMVMMMSRRAGDFDVLARGGDVTGRMRRAARRNIVGAHKSIIDIVMVEPANGRTQLRGRLADGIAASHSGLGTSDADGPIAPFASAPAQRTAGVAALRNRGAYDGNALRPRPVSGRAARTCTDGSRLNGVSAAGIETGRGPSERGGGGTGLHGLAVIFESVTIVISGTAPGRAA